MRNQWTRERIIRDILEREATGQPLTIGGQGVDKLMYAAARRIFGSWRNALQAAGIAPKRVLTWERWSSARILVMIRHLSRRQRPLTTEQMERRYSNIVSAARRHFGSWSKAVLAAGVDPTRLRRVIPWNQERVIEAILTRALRNEPLIARLVEPRSLVAAGKRFFGGWAAAVMTAGLDPQMTMHPPVRSNRPRTARAPTPRHRPLHAPRQLWTKELVIAAIHARLREQRPIGSSALAREDCGLYRAARRHHGSWRDALRAAGLDPSAYRRGPGGKPPSTNVGTRE